MISLSHMDEYASGHFNAKTWVPGLVHSGRGGGGEEKSGAQRPYNIHVIICIYLQLSKENPALQCVPSYHAILLWEPTMLSARNMSTFVCPLSGNVLW